MTLRRKITMSTRVALAKPNLASYFYGCAEWSTRHYLFGLNKSWSSWWDFANWKSIYAKIQSSTISQSSKTRILWVGDGNVGRQGIWREFVSSGNFFDFSFQVKVPLKKIFWLGPKLKKLTRMLIKESLCQGQDDVPWKWCLILSNDQYRDLLNEWTQWP